MSRIRSVHPGLFTDSAFVRLSDAAQIFYVGLLTEADDFGAFRWDPIELKMRLRAASLHPVEPLLAELTEHKRVVKYEHDGREYGLIRNFRVYQRPKKPKSQHFIPSEFRTFIGSPRASTELDDDKPSLIPRKAGISPQMEDGGGGEDGEEGSGGGDARSREVLDDEMRTWAKENAPHVIDLLRELDRYRDWKRSKGKVHRDERAGFRNWLRKAGEFAQNNHVNGHLLALPPDAETTRWDVRMRGFIESGQWHQDVYGTPDPLSQNCRVPPAVMAKWKPQLDAMRGAA